MFGKKKQKSYLELEAEDLEEELRVTSDPKERALILGELEEVYKLIGQSKPDKPKVQPDTWVKCGVVIGMGLLGWWADKNGSIIPKSFRSENVDRLFRL